jgi:hypothetical protein
LAAAATAQYAAGATPASIPSSPRKIPATCGLATITGGGVV